MSNIGGNVGKMGMEMGNFLVMDGLGELEGLVNNIRVFFGGVG